MILRSFQIGDIYITDTSFGHVMAGDSTFIERFRQRFDFAPEHIVWMDQTHSANVQVVQKPNSPTVLLPNTDGVLTSSPGVMLITKTADCIPILLWNERAKVIGALHCGWKGFMAGILENFAQVCNEHRLSLEDFSAFFGPHLRVKHFEVQDDFLEKVPEGKKVFLETYDGKMHYNLSLGAKTILNSLGLTKIEDDGTLDTFHSSDYFSYRGWSQLPDGKKPDHYNTFANCIILS